MQPELIHLGDDIAVHYYSSWLDDADRLSTEAETLSFSAETVTMYGIPNVICRGTVDYRLTYDYNATAKPSIEWEPLAVVFKQKLEQQFRSISRTVPATNTSVRRLISARTTTKPG
jgi:hypothetical protein